MITVKESTIHGNGVFALEEIEAGTHIGIFEGDHTDEDGEHVLWLLDEDSNTWYGVIGRNELRYLNHSLEPNAEFTAAGELYAIDDISVDEEITIHYGEDWET